MKVFVTGGTGLIGSRLIPRLVSSGHTVTCLTRSDASASAARAIGATPIMGDRLDLDVLSRAAADADGVVHLAFDHDRFSEFAQVCAEDRAIVTTLCDALGTTNKSFIAASGTLKTDGETEECPKLHIEAFPRWKSDELALSYAGKGVKAMIVRLPPVVHASDRQHPFLSAQIATAKKTGKAAYVGDGQQVWPAAHVDDAAAIFALALEKGEAGKVYHAVAEQGVPLKTIAETIADRLDIPTESLTNDEAMTRFGFIGGLLSMDNKTSSSLTQKWLGWSPTGMSLIEEIQGWKEF